MASNSEEEFRRDCGASDGERGGGASDGERGGGASGGEAAAPPYECVEGALEYAYVGAVDFDQKRGVTGQSAFDKERAGDVSCSCSQAFSLFSVIRIILVEWHRDGLLESCEREFKNLALSPVLDLLQGTKRQTTRASTLESCILTHLEAYLAAYGASSFKPKHHYATHLGRMLSHHKMLISCFTHERKHREVKRYANNLPNTSGAFEASILRDCLLRHVEDLQAETAEDADTHVIGLKAPIAPSPSQSAAFFPSALAYSDDVALLQDGLAFILGKVLFFASSPGKDWVCFKQWIKCGRNRFRESSAGADICHYNRSKMSVCTRWRRAVRCS